MVSTKVLSSTEYELDICIYNVLNYIEMSICLFDLCSILSTCCMQSDTQGGNRSRDVTLDQRKYGNMAPACSLPLFFCLCFTPPSKSQCSQDSICLINNTLLQSWTLIRSSLDLLPWAPFILQDMRVTPGGPVQLCRVPRICQSLGLPTVATTLSQKIHQLCLAVPFLLPLDHKHR